MHRRSFFHLLAWSLFVILCESLVCWQTLNVFYRYKDNRWMRVRMYELEPEDIVVIGEPRRNNQGWKVTKAPYFDALNLSWCMEAVQMQVAIVQQKENV
jgi:hypothetical protein